MENDDNSFREFSKYKGLIEKISRKTASMYREGRVKAEIEIDDFKGTITFIRHKPESEKYSAAEYNVNLKDSGGFEISAEITIFDKFNPSLN